MTEAEAILIICAMLSGEPEVRHNYEIDTGKHHIRVDCETDLHVIEVGLDKRSSLDSVQQADFASWLSGKKGKVIIVDTDGREGSIEYRIDTAARRLGVEYETVSDEFLRRWQMTVYFREVRDRNQAIR
jgi:hypothetical protein